MAEGGDCTTMTATWMNRHRTMFEQATRHPFIRSIRDGTVNIAYFKRWLAQDYIFVREFVPFIASILLKTCKLSDNPSDVEVVLGGVASLNDEISWFKKEASKWEVHLLSTTPQETHIEYCRFLQNLTAAEVSYPVAISAFWAIETVYQESFAFCIQSGSKTPAELKSTCRRWGNAEFGQYGLALQSIADRCLSQATNDEVAKAEEIFQNVLSHEINFWNMSSGTQTFKMNSMDPVNKKKSESHSSSSNWSNLPTDILIIISDKIKDIADFSRFRSVCKSWNLASKNSTFKSPQIPWLLLPYDSRTSTRSFINPLTEAIFNFDIPEAFDHAIIGSSNGWLVLINKNFKLTILNPITHAQVEHYIPQLTYFKVITKVNSPQGLSYIAESLRCYVHMSPNYPESLTDCVLAFSVKDYKHVLFCKIGDKSWKTIRCLARNICSLAYHRGKIYVICEGTGYVGVCDPKSDSMVVKSINVEHSCFSYFVKRENELLLLVDRRSDDDYDYDDCIKLVDFEVYKLEDSSDNNNSHDSGDDSGNSNSETDYETDSDNNSCYTVSDDDDDDDDDGDGSDKNCDYDSDYDEGFADYSDGDFDDFDIEESSDTWLEYNGWSTMSSDTCEYKELEYNELGDYTIFFTSEVVSTIFCCDPSYFEGKSVCYPTNKVIVGYLDGIQVCDLDDQTEETNEETVAYLGDQRFCPYDLKPIWFAPSLH